MKPSLRTPLSSDYTTLTTWIPNAAACARWAGSSFPFPFVADALPELLRKEGGFSFSMVSPHNQLLGFGQFWPRTKEGMHLGRIIIDPNRRGQGLGRTLLNFLLGEVTKTAQPELVTLGVYRDNAVAVALYSRLGFRSIEAGSDPDVMEMAMTLKSAGPGQTGTSY